MSIVFRQLFDEETCTLTYLLADAVSGDAIMVDSVREHVGRYLALLQDLNLQLRWLLETHVHADHITGAGGLSELTGAKIVAAAAAGTHCADHPVAHGDTLVFGSEVIRIIATPGHTPGCLTYQWRDRIFTGDALLINGCGRTDFQGGDAGILFDSITGHLFTLPDETLVFPGHDYKSMRVSSIGQEKVSNARFSGRNREEFIALMATLKLPAPKHMDEALPANLRCGRNDTTMDHHAA
jgi:sulfur dioxygenase